MDEKYAVEWLHYFLKVTHWWFDDFNSDLADSKISFHSFSTFSLSKIIQICKAAKYLRNYSALVLK